MKQIFPKSIIDSTVEVHRFKHSTKSQVIYSIILAALIIAIALLPFIKVDIYSSARGIIKPGKERLSITSLNSGRVLKVNLKNNALVHKGDTLLVLDNTIVDEKLELSKQQIKELHLFIEDLFYLLKSKRINVSNFKSNKYKQEYLLHQQNLMELQIRFKKLEQDFKRSEQLFNKGVIAKLEFENTTLDYNLAKSNLNQLHQKRHSAWQTNLTEYKNRLLELESNKNQLEQNKSQLVITAPISGILINTPSLEVGSYINVGHFISEISPNTALLAECYIAPKDIGLLKLNNPVNFQIDAYNYNQWGLATGQIIEIGQDVEFVENTPTFKVRCRINEKELKLKNGFNGKLKKGMTFNAQFKLIERSLFDLLYDKVDDWVNPSQKEIVNKD
ncbi:HlyD family secretion protein [Aestuariivivens insulae]|uniref:HlyD family secretion protein n=1 Tax=Aestuariivivens insulae TaxID=1621988 RepID=UPI001F5A0163|nr:HlyD family efflux transporter periplasmic adaptor subunit [Aestuariivivens insulae]